MNSDSCALEKKKKKGIQMKNIKFRLWRKDSDLER